MEMVGDLLEEEVKELRESYRSRRTKSEVWRKSQLKGLLSLLNDKEEEIFKALFQDLGKHQVEAYRDEVGILIKSVNFALQNLKQWMTTKKVPVPNLIYPSTAEIVPEPLGLVLIFSSWNFPIGLSLEPLIGAVAAGNVVVLKPSELAPSCSALLAKLVPLYLDSKAVKVVQGGEVVAERLLEKKWDKIFFTGSPRVGRIVMTAAAKHLTPVTLELGGKCPAVVDYFENSREKKIALKRLVSGKYSPCSGQACVGVDYILVDENFAPALIELIKATTKRMFGENPKETHSSSRIINKQHFLRLKSLLDDPKVKASIVHGGSTDEDNLFIEPTILLNPPLKAHIMNEEIFGPLLPVITLKKIEDSIEFINSRPKPLALYVFTKNETLKRRMISETSSGSLTFNDTIIQYLCDTIPFGGVGQSGFGNYHGKFSFDTFSHNKPIMRTGFLTDFWFRYPPWNDYKLGILRSAFTYNYLRFVLLLLGLKKA
ncbi:hypothetical protein GIB67_006729 [Kingdonia uniflora]|uniref:Aldehyde dehydrogenase n=1 Tax=Kingdonia uniflora TaxID=39325 RepID=A0A7J7LYM6_9MAGN|nr:hypothetical protein GIB67_006729 [Kingdonia uniflora]